jgi:hypothetical protein
MRARGKDRRRRDSATVTLPQWSVRILRKQQDENSAPKTLHVEEHNQQSLLYVDDRSHDLQPVITVFVSYVGSELCYDTVSIWST